MMRERWMAWGLCGLLAACGQAPGTAQRGNLDPMARLSVGEAAERSGDKDTAVAMYTAAAEGAPDDTVVQVRAASGLARTGKWNQARDLLLKDVKAHPNDPDLLRTLAAIYVMAGQPSYAVARLDEVLATRPNDLNAIVDKAVALDLQGRHSDAQALYRRALAIAPGDATVSNNFALSLMIEGRLREAQGVLEPFGEMDDVPERLRTNLAVIYAASGQPEKARRILGDRISDADLAAITRALARGGAVLPATR